MINWCRQKVIWGEVKTSNIQVFYKLVVGLENWRKEEEQELREEEFWINRSQARLSKRAGKYSSMFDFPRPVGEMKLTRLESIQSKVRVRGGIKGRVRRGIRERDRVGIRVEDRGGIRVRVWMNLQVEVCKSRQKQGIVSICRQKVVKVYKNKQRYIFSCKDI